MILGGTPFFLFFIQEVVIFHGAWPFLIDGIFGYLMAFSSRLIHGINQLMSGINMNSFENYGIFKFSFKNLRSFSILFDLIFSDS